MWFTLSQYDRVLKHYGNPTVQQEVAEYSRHAWVGLHCEELDSHGRKILVRYLGRKRIPIQITQPPDVLRLLSIYKRLRPRTFYATANIYRQLSTEEDTVDFSNIEACTPTWDVDNTMEKWESTAAAVREITAFLESSGLSRSVIIKFSGRGAHVQVHPLAISPELRMRVNPLDLAYALVEHVRVKVYPKVSDLAIKFEAGSLRVDNEMDVQRLFVCPLSIHKEVDKVSVCINPNDLDSFTPENADLGSFKHYQGWKSHVVGEADQLASYAYNQLGGCPSMPKPIRGRRHPPLDRQIVNWLDKLKNNRTDRSQDKPA